MKVFGPYIHKTGRAHGRQYVNIVHDDGRKTTTMYARYLMEQHLGRELLPTETVDHIDDDKTNDSIENLQILTRSDNAKKAHLSLGTHITWLDLTCDLCKSPFKRNARFDRHNRKQGKTGTYCGRSCAGKVNAKLRLY